MHVEYAQLPPPEDSADRIFVSENAVIVLDGATAFIPVPVSAQTYANHLGHRLLDHLKTHPEIDLRDALAEAISQTAANLDLQPDASPSSTVAVLRERANAYDLLVLGDSPIIWSSYDRTRHLTDNRLADIAMTERDTYRARLREGHGFDDRHRELLRDLQATQCQHRNTHGGFWIAATDPAAARHSLIRSVERNALDWAALATDGAVNPLNYKGYDDWPAVINSSGSELAELLRRLRDWERDSDPHGQQYQRAKRHDDKTLVTVRPQP